MGYLLVGVMGNHDSYSDPAAAVELERLQVLNQIALLLITQAQSEEHIVVADHVEEGGKGTVVVETTLLMRPEPLEGRGAITLV
jgi:hypothetical protein